MPLMADQVHHFFCGSYIVDSSRVVPIADGEELAIGRHGHTEDFMGLLWEFSYELRRGDIPKRNGAAEIIC